MAKSKKIFRILMRIAQRRGIAVLNIQLVKNINGIWCQNKIQELILLDYNQLQDLDKRNFVLAHELGHSTLHKPKMDSALYKENNFNNHYRRTIENEADEYAKQLIDIIDKLVEGDKNA